MADYATMSMFIDRYTLVYIYIYNTVTVQAKVQGKTRILCHIRTRMHTNAYIFEKLGFTTTIQEYFVVWEIVDM